MNNIIIDKASLKILEGSKVDFVSELMGTSFKISNPNEKLSVAIDQRDKEGKLLFASQDGIRVNLTTKNLILAYLKNPLMTIKIISAIHYEAFRLWLKGIKLIKKKFKIKNNISIEN